MREQEGRVKGRTYEKTEEAVRRRKAQRMVAKVKI